MTSIDSSSISRRTSADGQASPKMCSFRASPDPTPSEKRPSSRTADVAAACAITAGWMRIVGQVTPVVTCMPGTACGERADHRPDERALALLVVPRVVVVGDPEPVDAGLLGERGLLEQFARGELLAGEEVADLHRGPLPAGPAVLDSPPR